MPLEWTFRPRAGRRHGDVSRYEARIGHGLFLSVRKEYATSRGSEEWQIIAIKRAEMAHVSGLQAAQDRAVEMAREQLVAALDMLGTPDGRQDATRYRWLRDHGHIMFMTPADEVDRTVDQEMAKPRDDLADLI
jgi:hypothetical protein